MITIRVYVAKFEFLSFREEDPNFIGAAKLYGGSRAGLKITECSLDETSLSSLGAVKHLKNQMRQTVVLDHSTFSDFCWRRHVYDRNFGFKKFLIQ